MSLTDFHISASRPGETHSQYALRNLRRNIMEYGLKPGEQLNEAELAALLGVSRTPVHEAVMALRDEHLVDVIPRRESRVSLIDLDLVNEGVFLRCAVEPELVRALAGNMPREYLASMKESLARQEAIFQTGTDMASYYDEDDFFHKQLYFAANKARCYNAVHTLCAHFDRVRYLVRLQEDTEIENSSLAEHRTMLMYLSLGVNQEEDLNRMFRSHIMRFQTMLPKYIEIYRDYFKAH